MARLMSCSVAGTPRRNAAVPRTGPCFARTAHRRIAPAGPGYRDEIVEGALAFVMRPFRVASRFLARRGKFEKIRPFWDAS